MTIRRAKKTLKKSKTARKMWKVLKGLKGVKHSHSLLVHLNSLSHKKMSTKAMQKKVRSMLVRYGVTSYTYYTTIWKIIHWQVIHTTVRHVTVTKTWKHDKKFVKKIHVWMKRNKAFKKLATVLGGNKKMLKKLVRLPKRTIYTLWRYFNAPAYQTGKHVGHQVYRWLLKYGFWTMAKSTFKKYKVLKTIYKYQDSRRAAWKKKHARRTRKVKVVRKRKSANWHKNKKFMTMLKGWIKKNKGFAAVTKAMRANRKVGAKIMKLRRSKIVTLWRYINAPAYQTGKHVTRLVYKWLAKYGVWNMAKKQFKNANKVVFKYQNSRRAAWIKRHQRHAKKHARKAKKTKKCWTKWIKKATYGPKDVTRIVRRLNCKNVKVFEATNRRFGDPKKGLVKHLKITFKWGGKTRKLSVKEHTGDKISLKTGRIIRNKRRSHKKRHVRKAKKSKKSKKVYYSAA
jgi:hypothetical protein